MKYLLILFFIFIFSSSKGQVKQPDRGAIDSAFSIFLDELTKDSSPENKVKIVEGFKRMDDQSKMLMILFTSMSHSSKQDLVQNIDTNYKNVMYLKNLIDEIKTSELSYIEISPPVKILNKGEELHIRLKDRGQKKTFENFEIRIDLNSNKLDGVLSIIHWDKKTFEAFRTALKKANCVCVEMEDPIEIGFSYSGLALYSYKVFNSYLSKEQITEYNDSCTNIYYGKNIVLTFGGGAIGPQCFNKIQENDTEQQNSAATDSLLLSMADRIAKDSEERSSEEFKKKVLDKELFTKEISELPVKKRKDAISNIDSNYSAILALKDMYLKIVPEGHIVYVNFNPPLKSFGESVDIRAQNIHSDMPTYLVLVDHVDLKDNSLDSSLLKLGWDRSTLYMIRSELQKTNCASIENGNTTEIGFNVNRHGSYTYLIFNYDLDKKSIEEFSSACYNLVYNKNIVIRYIGIDCPPE